MGGPGIIGGGGGGIGGPGGSGGGGIGCPGGPGRGGGGPGGPGRGGALFDGRACDFEKLASWHALNKNVNRNRPNQPIFLINEPLQRKFLASHMRFGESQNSRT